jgi:hypothetical protein
MELLAVSIGPHRVLRFSRDFLAAFVVLVVLYPWMLRSYERMVLGTANAVLAFLAPEAQIRIASDARWMVDVLSANPHWGFTLGTARLGLLIYINLILLPALLVATPIRFRERLGLLARGVPILFGVHVASLIVCVHGMSCVCHDPASGTCQNLPGILTPGGQGMAVIVWGFLTWRYWFPKQISPSPVSHPRIARREVR